MRVFKYRIYRNNGQCLVNWINAETREDALQKLENVKKEYDADEIRLTEVFGARQWRC